jgi:hypothetical protein
VQNRAYVTIIGRRPKPGKGGFCSAHPAELRGKVLTIDPPKAHKILELVFREYSGKEVVHTVVR